MQTGTQDHKAMPDYVVEVQLLPHVEDNSRRVSHAAGEQEPKGAWRQGLGERIEDSDPTPSDACI